MKKKLLLLFLIFFITPIISSAAVMTTLEIEFAFTTPDNPAQQLLGYRLYKEGEQVCESNDPNASTITCDIPTEEGTFNFTLAAYYSDSTESPQSPSFPFTIDATGTPPVTLPPDDQLPPIPPPSTGSKTISYSWDTTSVADLTGYRMYMNDALLCETTAADATSLSCNADLISAPMAFSVTTLDSNGIESAKSNILLLDPTDFPDTLPAPEPLLAVINPSQASGEVPLSVSFAGTNSTGDIQSYAWEFGDGSTATGAITSHTYSFSGTYTATLHIVDQSGATHQVNTTITALPSTAIPQPPTAVLSSSTAAGNAPLVVTFDGTASTSPNPPIVKYSWTFGDGSQATGEKASHSFTTAGTYHTQLTVEDSKGLTDSIDTPIIIIGTVEPNLKPTAIIATNLTGGDAPITISFDGSKSSDSDGSITGYSWNFGDGTTGSGQMTQHTYTSEGIYTVSLQVTDDKGETAITTTKIACNTTLPGVEFNIEVGEVSIDHAWVKVLFANSFSQPIVVAGPPTSNDTEPVLVRIRNIDQQGFEVRLQEWDYQDGSHAPEIFSYLVMEKGKYTLDNGSKVEAGSFTGTTSFQQIALQQSYVRIPIILSQAITENEADAVTGRIRNVTQSAFAYKLQEQETTITSHVNETIGYVAWEPGTGEIANMIYEVGTTTDSVTQNWLDVTFLTEFPSLPLFIAGMQTTDGADTATVRSQNMSQTATQIKIEEEQSNDTEIGHTTEVVGYLVLGSKTAATEPPATPTSLEKKFTFTWDYGDTQNISGFRFFLNGNQICETINPDDRQITCYTALLNDTMEFTMKAIYLDGTEGIPSNLLTLNPTDYPEIFGIRLVTFSWEYDDSLENTISGFRIYNNEQLICETADPTVRQISCKTETLNAANNFSVVAVQVTDSETSPSNYIQYQP